MRKYLVGSIVAVASLLATQSASADAPCCQEINETALFVNMVAIAVPACYSESSRGGNAYDRGKLAICFNRVLRIEAEPTAQGAALPADIKLICADFGEGTERRYVADLQFPEGFELREPIDNLNDCRTVEARLAAGQQSQ